jgi:hypothetical protein
MPVIVIAVTVCVAGVGNVEMVGKGEGRGPLGRTRYRWVRYTCIRIGVKRNKNGMACTGLI